MSGDAFLQRLKKQFGEQITGGTTAVVYVIDTTNGLLSAIAYDDAQSRLETMPPLDLTRYFEAGMNINRRDNR